jgi:hypothetical protein
VGGELKTAGGADSAIYFAAPLLATLRAEPAIAPLVGLLERAGGEDDYDLVETLIDALPLFGPPVVGPLLALVRNQNAVWYARSVALDIAVAAASQDPARRAEVAVAGRTLLDGCLAAAGAQPDAPGDILAKDDIVEMVSSLVSSLADLADPEARPLIDAAFAAIWLTR